MIAGQLEADIQELADKKGRAGMLGFLRAGRDAIKRKTTELEPLKHQPDGYQLIVLGTPVWASNPAPAVRTFLQSHDLSGKKVALFCTMDARGGEEVCANLKDLIRDVEVVGHLAVAMKRESLDQIEGKVTQWAAQLKS
jgi:hypothetical protein